MNNLKKTDKLCISYVNTLRFLGNRSKNTFRCDLNFEEITYLSSLFMAFSSSVLGKSVLRVYFNVTYFRANAYCAINPIICFIFAVC